MSTTQHASAAVPITRTPPDVRGFWRVLLAVIAPVPMLFQGLTSILTPVDGDASFEDYAAAFAANPGRAELVQWLGIPFLVLLVPAAFAVAWVARRRVPRLATAGALVAGTGFLAGFGILGGVPSASYLAVRGGLDVTSISALETAMAEYPVTLLGGLLFILGITFGLLLLGIALWRSRVAPAWMGIALGLGGFTHPFLPGHVLAGLGLLVAAVGFAGASWALLRTSNDDFDLPPLP
jgi:hypothetical protein